MRIGVGIPNSHPAATGALILDFARRAEAAGLSRLATIGRIAYPSHEELVALAAAAGATSRIGLMTNVLLGPARDPVLLAKQAASLDQLSRGRFVLGVGVGSRPDDFLATGTGFRDRGRRWDDALELMHAAWRGEAVHGAERPIGPPPTAGPSVPMVFGGGSDQTVARVIRWGIGYTASGGPDIVGPMFAKVRAAWSEAGREGSPTCSALTYFALGPDAESGGDCLRDYYGDFGAMIWSGTPRTPAAIKESVAAHERIGADELILVPTLPVADQVDRLAEAVR
jgi:alkanesulfonate monooxygenase SsuD/methylene tetrahydromethanopterin reductase-like flavin-dependent oxidoreductase (luciferase family)